MANLSNINNILRTSSAGVGINCDAEFSLDIENTNIYERGGRSYIQKPIHRIFVQLKRFLNI